MKIRLLLLLSILLTLSLGSCTQAPSRDGVFIHLSHGADNPHRALMALTMATRMSNDKDVLVYLDIEAVHLVLKDATPVEHAEFESSDALLKKLVDSKATIMACPTCLKVAGKEPGDLAPGFQVANKEVFFSFTKGRILSLDY